MSASGTITALRARVAELESEVARLKKDLAAANAKTLPAPPAKTVGETLDVIGVSPSGRGKVSLSAAAEARGEPLRHHPASRCAQFCGVLHTHSR